MVLLETDYINNFINSTFIVSGILFILALAGLSKHESSKRGNAFGILGMALALIAAVVSMINGDTKAIAWVLLVVAMIIGAAIGLWKAAKVEMTGMPELVAQLHSFVGLAAVLIGINTYIEHPDADAFHMYEMWIGVFIGAVTFTGSIVAWGKLSGKMKSAPLTLPGRNWLNLGGLIAIIAFGVWFANGGGWLP
ncbi:NAD(P)(+) transhydrogenase (Re/Si-specific) subunit beta, partial [Propionibacterium freudenreichii]